MSRTIFLCLMISALLGAQSTGTRTIQANGSATLTANPDQAQIDVGVVTVETTAQDSGRTGRFRR
jgi:uncharacterized protein YggE